MIYLLDVNVLVALALIEHTLNTRVVGWLQANSSLQLATCPITELGFVRVIAQTPGYGLTVAQAKRPFDPVETANAHSVVAIPLG